MQRATAQALVVAGAGLFLAISLLVGSGLFDEPDLVVDRFVVANFGESQDRAWRWFSSPGDETMAVAATVFGALFCWRVGARRSAVILVAVSMTGGLLVDGFKDAYGRPFPADGEYVVDGIAAGENETILGDVETGRGLRVNETDGRTWLGNLSFRPADLSRFPDDPARAYPSGHTMGATVSWGLAILMGVRAVQRRTRLDPVAVGFALAIAVMVGISRVHLRTHWMSDVLGSWGLGAALIGIAFLLDDALKARWPDRPLN